MSHWRYFHYRHPCANWHIYNAYLPTPASQYEWDGTFVQLGKVAVFTCRHYFIWSVGRSVNTAAWQWLISIIDYITEFAGYTASCRQLVLIRIVARSVANCVEVALKRQLKRKCEHGYPWNWSWLSGTAYTCWSILSGVQKHREKI